MLRTTFTNARFHTFFFTFFLFSLFFLRFEDNGLTREVLIQWTHNTIVSHKKFVSRHQPVLCHGDAKVDNFIINERTGDVLHVDVHVNEII